MYLYRCTEQQLPTHLERIADEGDALLHVVFKGGRDYVLICRKAAERPPAPNLAIDGVPETITRDEYLSLVGSVGFDVKQLGGLRFAVNGIYATVFATDAQGRKVLAHEADRETTVAKHEVFIKVVD